jgi:hypothetical protein
MRKTIVVDLGKGSGALTKGQWGAVFGMLAAHAW